MSVPRGCISHLPAASSRGVAILGQDNSGMYAVRFVGADQLPVDHAWVLARDEDGSCYLFVKRCELCARVLEEAWAAYRWLARRFSSVA